MGTVSPYIRTKKYASFFTMSKTFWIIVFVYLMKARGEAEDSSSLVDDDSTKSAADPVDTQDDVDAASAVAAVKDAVEGKNDEILMKLENLTAEIRAHYAKPRTPGGIGRIVNDGTPGSTSNGYYQPINAFTTSEASWYNVDGQFPAAVWMRFGRTYRLAKIGFRAWAPVGTGNWPTVTEVVGSNDCSRWTTLLYINNKGGFTQDKEYREFTIASENRLAFSCLGLRWPSRNGCNGYVRLGHIQMWEQV